MPNNKFTFYESYLTMVEPLSTAEEKLELLMSVIRYALYDEQPKLQGALLSVFLATKPNVDNDLKRRAILKANGSAGGRPKKEEEKPNDNQTKPNNNQTKPNDNQNGYDARGQETEIETEIEIETLTTVSGSLVKNKILNNIKCAGARTKLEELLKNDIFKTYFQYFRDYYGDTETELEKTANFVVLVMADMIIQASKPEKFKFRKQVYDLESLLEILECFDEDCLRSVIASLNYRDDIKNKTLYTKGAILEQAEQKKKNK